MKERNWVKGWKIKLRFGERGLPPIESGPQCGASAQEYFLSSLEPNP